MKELAVIAAGIAAAVACAGETGVDRIDGSNPLVKTRFTADPAGYSDGEWFYVFMGHDDDRAKGYLMFDWSVVRTKDMVAWEDLGTVMTLRETFPWARHDMAWASQAVKRNGKWYWYVATARARGRRGDAIAVAVADDLKGPWKDPVGGPMAEGRGFIDPSVIVDDDGKAYLFWGNHGGDPGMWYAQLKDNMIEFEGEIKPVPGLLDAEAFGQPLRWPNNCGNHRRGSPQTNFVEAPWIYKVGDTYYLEYASGGLPEKWSYSTAKSIHGPWKFGGKIMDNAGGTHTIHGGSVFHKGEWYMLYHDGNKPGGGDKRRSVRIERYTRNPDGSIPFITPTAEGVKAR
jgi:beta-xylosidase